MIWRTLFVLTAWLLSAAAWAHGDESHDTAPPALGLPWRRAPTPIAKCSSC